MKGLKNWSCFLAAFFCIVFVPKALEVKPLLFTLPDHATALRFGLIGGAAWGLTVFAVKLPSRLEAVVFGMCVGTVLYSFFIRPRGKT